MTTRGKHLGGIRTLDDLKARTAEVGDCWEWQCGYQNHGKTPAVVYIDKRMSGRRLALMLAKPGQKLDGKVVIAKCGNYKCVNPDHMLALTKEQSMVRISKLANQVPTRRLKISATKRAQSHITDEIVRAAQSMPGTSRAVAQALGISHASVTAFRRGHRRTTGPSLWGGLMQRAST